VAISHDKISHDKISHDDERQRLANSKTAMNSDLLEWLLATTKTATTMNGSDWRIAKRQRIAICWSGY
jgi:hypothetical protein